jgi:hypothetical protein
MVRPARGLCNAKLHDCQIANKFFIVDPTHFNIGNIAIEFTSDDFDMSEQPPGPDGGPIRRMLYCSYF